MAAITRKVGATLTWEEYCAEVGVDPQAARRATVTQAFSAYLTSLDIRLRAPRVPSFDAEPSEPSDNGRPF